MPCVGFLYPEGCLCQQNRVDVWLADLVAPINREAAPINKVMDRDGWQLVVKMLLTDPLWNKSGSICKRAGNLQLLAKK